MKSIDINDLELIILSPRNTDLNDPLYCYYEQFYNDWKHTWTSAYKKLGLREGDIELYSDELYKQDELVAIYYKGEFVGGGANTVFNLESNIDQNSSYFKNWNDLIKKQVLNKIEGNHILACGNFTITSKFNTKSDEFPWKALVLVTLMERSLMQNNGPIISCTNSNKKVSQASISVGAKVLVENQLFKFSNGAQDYVDILSTDASIMSKLRYAHPLFKITEQLFKKFKSNSDLELNLNSIYEELNAAA
ncbi:hypothetical protein ABMA75_00755 [Halobacteriovorax sp. ZH4_bin.1]|uniref:hypothetical protein n=1 Tax=unclassified Halobacteriovorax TaxID=2639665 RepID=UPI003722D3CD